MWQNKNELLRKVTDSNYNTYSLAITCHRCGINVFEYLCDIIDRCAAWLPNIYRKIS